MASKKKRKVLTNEEAATVLSRLKELKRKYAPRMLALCKTVQDALVELEEQNQQLDNEAELIQPNYIEVVQDFKVTFEPSYREHNAELDDPEPTLLEFAELIEYMSADASTTADSGGDNAVTTTTTDPTALVVVFERAASA